jgi:hypothetical protein
MTYLQSFKKAFPSQEGCPKGGVCMFLKIYVILGREVSTLVNEQLKPGAYEVNWDGSNYASGIYFYSLQTGEFTETKKLILMK